MTKKRKPTPNCYAGYDPLEAEGCDPVMCKSCGWNPVVAAKRKAHIRRYGLTICKDLKRRLIINTEEGTL